MAEAEEPGDDADVPIGPTLTLRLSNSCHRHLSWDLLHAPQVGLRVLAARPPAGFALERRVLGLVELGAPEGHRIILVEGSGRTQIRVHYGTPAGERRDTALAIARGVAAVLGRAVS